MNILVTGGAGYVGSVCAEELLAAGNSVVVLDNLSTGHRDAVPSSATFVEGDFGDATLIRDIVREHKIEAAMHFAGETLVGKSMSDPQPYFRTNVHKGVDFLDALLTSGVRRLIFSSTAAVYGEPLATPITEEHPKNPINAYGESKLMFERILDWYQKAYKLHYATPRYFNAAGASKIRGEHHSPETHLIPLLLQSLLDPDYEFVIHGGDYPTADGTCIRDYVHVADIARSHILALQGISEGRFQGPFNVGTSKGFSVLQVLKAVEEVTGSKLKFRIGPRREGDPAILVASHERLTRELGWQASLSGILDIVRTAWEWRKLHPDGYASSVEVQLPVRCW
jgi:UDP-glucose 4-epimerase